MSVVPVEIKGFGKAVAAVVAFHSKVVVELVEEVVAAGACLTVEELCVERPAAVVAAVVACTYFRS